MKESGIKTVLFDVDRVIIIGNRRFSENFSQEFDVSMERIIAFFENEFQQCLVGKADLKEELGKYLEDWGWKKSTDELLEYWFSREREVDEQMIESLHAMRKQGIRCYFATNNEKYRTSYLADIVGLKSHVDGIFASCDIGYVKNQKEFWEAVYVSLGTSDKKNVLVWDDDEQNIQSAAKFGFRAEFYLRFKDLTASESFWFCQ